MNPRVLDVIIRNRDGILFEGPCQSLSSYNDIGKFDVLGEHANFITLVSNEIDLVTSAGEERKIKVDNGVCKVRENKVAIFLGINKELTR